MNLTDPLSLLVCAALFGCSGDSRTQVQGAAWSEHTPLQHPPGGFREGPALPIALPCELAERAGRCRLEALAAVDAEDSDREIVATYAVLDPASHQRIEHRARVWYLGVDESQTLAHLRANPVVPCRWQTVIQGACPAYPGRVEIPELRDVRNRHHRARRSPRHTLSNIARRKQSPRQRPLNTGGRRSATAARPSSRSVLP